MSCPVLSTWPVSKGGNSAQFDLVRALFDLFNLFRRRGGGGRGRGRSTDRVEETITHLVESKDLREWTVICKQVDKQALFIFSFFFFILLVFLVVVVVVVVVHFGLILLFSQEQNHWSLWKCPIQIAAASCPLLSLGQKSTIILLPKPVQSSPLSNYLPTLITRAHIPVVAYLNKF